MLINLIFRFKMWKQTSLFIIQRQAFKEKIKLERFSMNSKAYNLQTTSFFSTPHKPLRYGKHTSPLIKSAIKLYKKFSVHFMSVLIKPNNGRFMVCLYC